MATIHAPVPVGRRRWAGPVRLVVIILLGLAAVVGAINVSDAMSRPRGDLLACERFAAVMTDERSDLVTAYGNLDEAAAHARGTAVSGELEAVIAAAGAARSGDGGMAGVVATTERFTAACRQRGWHG